MKRKALFLALATAGAGASFALGNNGHPPRGTTSSPAKGCTPFQLRGKLVSVATTSFTVDVVESSQAVPGSLLRIAVTPDTHVLWAARGLLKGPNPGDAVWANGKRCGAGGHRIARNVQFQAPIK